MLQATFCGLDEPERVGSYRLHYADGETVELAIEYGRDLRKWWTDDDPTRATPDASVVWTGNNPVVGPNNSTLRLFKRSYANPRPDVEINCIDFISAMNFPAPFVVAITVE